MDARFRRFSREWLAAGPMPLALAILATRPGRVPRRPLAGMGPHESQRMVELIKKLSEGHAIMLIEHDMDAVFAVAHRLTVMVNGEVIESGTPEAVRNSPAVQLAYLGGEDNLHG